MKGVVSFLLYTLITNRIFIMKNLNIFLDKDKDIKENLFKTVKLTCMISYSKQKKLINDFRQGKVFMANERLLNKILNDK